MKANIIQVKIKQLSCFDSCSNPMHLQSFRIQTLIKKPKSISQIAQLDEEITKWSENSNHIQQNLTCRNWSQIIFKNFLHFSDINKILTPRIRPPFPRLTPCEFPPFQKIKCRLKFQTSALLQEILQKATADSTAITKRFINQQKYSCNQCVFAERQYWLWLA